MNHKNILVTSAGVATALNVMSALRESQRYSCKIVATDMSENSAGLYLADKYYITSSARSESFIDEILSIIKEENIDFIFPLHSSETDFFSKNKSIFEKLGVGLIIPEPSSIAVCENKDMFTDFLKSHKFDYPKTYNSKNEIIDYPVFIKPKVGSSSTGAKKINSRLELDFFLRSNENDYLIQEYVNWQEITIDCYVNQNGKLVGFVPRIRIKVKDGKSVVARTICCDEIIALSERLLTNLKFKGACNIQMFLNEGSVRIVEINPRLAAGGLPLATKAGVNIPELMIRDYFDGVSNDFIPYEKNLTMFRYLSEVFI